MWQFICPTTKQALQWIIQHLQQEIQAIQDILLSQEEDPNVIFIEAKPILDDNNPIQFELPPALLQQETEATLPHPNLDNASLLAVTNLPHQPMRHERIQEARHRAREWAAT